MKLKDILIKYRDDVIQEYVKRLQSEVSSRYSKRPYDELLITCSAAYDASYFVLVHNDFSKINCHIGWISNYRLHGGFSLSEVQHAYELNRILLLPIFVKELKGVALINAVHKLNECLFYTITKFSDYFQSLHEKQIMAYTQNLEGEVEKRTKELAESESKYRLLVEGINDGYFVNQRGVIVFANQAYCDLHGYALQEIIGKPYTELIAPKSLNFVQRLYEQRMEEKESDELYMYFRRHKDGRAIPTENKVKRILYEGEYAVAGICRDITERIEAERRIRESERLAHIGKLTTSLAHEIRNPLSSIKMNIQILLKNIEFDGNDKRRMEIMTNEITRLERILGEMLDFAKPLTLDLKPVSINRVIDSCLEIVDVRIKEKNIDIIRRYSKEIPFLLLDKDKIEQAIINVLLNSIEVLDNDGRIGVSTRQVMDGNNFVKVEISDNGPGIREEDLPFVFNPFFNSKKKGTGLGLFNVKKIIEAHGGTVSLTPRKPHGIHFLFSIPLTEAK